MRQECVQIAGCSSELVIVGKSNGIDGAPSPSFELEYLNLRFEIGCVGGVRPAAPGVTSIRRHLRRAVPLGDCGIMPRHYRRICNSSQKARNQPEGANAAAPADKPYDGIAIKGV